MYSFACEHCGKHFEQIVAYDRRGAVICPDCGGATRVLLSTFAVKGGGASSPTPAPPSSRFT